MTELFGYKAGASTGAMKSFRMEQEEGRDKSEYQLQKPRYKIQQHGLWA
jgi:hypothetical protein